MNPTLKQTIASFLAFASGYATFMYTNHVPDTTFFTWGAFSSGLIPLIAYHGGLFQSSPLASAPQKG